MSIVINEVRCAAYLNSLMLMRISREVAALAGVEEAGVFIGTPANKDILRDAGILGPDGETAEPGDLILALRACDDAAGAAALAAARRLIDQPRAADPSASGLVTVRTIRTAIQTMPGANLALISVPGPFAAVEARKALRIGLNVMIFSDNVPVAEEAALKREARDLGLLVMGPDCGTSIIAGLPLGFANVVPRGDIGLIGASGTGIQEVSCLIAQTGGGISHAIGTGGHDLDARVGAIATLMAVDALEGDAQTRHVVLISKPPDAAVARLVLDRVAQSRKPFTICFLGGERQALPPNARGAATLRAAAEAALGRALPPGPVEPPSLRADRGRLVRGLFAGGTLCAEAQIVFRQAGLGVASNVPVPGADALGEAKGRHVMIDLGDDEFTRGRPHPMIEPAMRDGPLAAALDDPEVGVALIDIVLGFGAHPDPAGHVAQFLARRPGTAPIVASVVGTDADPQPRVDQVQKLRNAGVIVAASAADAAETAMRAIGACGR